MKKILCTAVLILSAAGCFPQEQEAPDAARKALSAGYEALLGTLMDLTAENTSLLNFAPEAHIGKLFPALPPHFSAGLSASAVIVDPAWWLEPSNALIDEINGKLEENGSSDSFKHFDAMNVQPLPACSINARIGGFILPFDIGVFGIATIPQTEGRLLMPESRNLDASYMAFGADIRYAVCEGGVILPKISLGAGYAYIRRNMEYARTEAVSLDGVSGAAGFGVTASMQQHTVSAQLQVSKKLFIFTPFVGAKALLSFGESDCSWQYAIETDGSEILAEGSGSVSYKRSASFSNVAPQVFAGLGVTVGFFQLGLSAAWNPASNYWSAAAAARFRM